MNTLKCVLAITLVLWAASSAHTQVMHLTPVARSLPSDTVLLSIRLNPTPTDTFPADATLKIQNGKLYIIRPNRVTQQDLGDGSIGEFIKDFSDDHKGVVLVTRYPERRVSEFMEGYYALVNDTVSIPARQGRPQIAAALGVGFIANEVRPSGTSNTLLRNAGLDLDLVATKPFDFFTVRARVGLHSAEPVPAQETSVEQPDSTTVSAAADAPQDPVDPRSAIESAQSMVVGLNFDVPLPFKWTIDASQAHVSIGGDVSQFWANPDPYVFPTIPVGTERKPIEEVFSAEEIASARDGLDRVLPLRTFLAGPRMMFGSGDHYVFYLMADYGWRQYQDRRFGIRYVITPATDTEPEKRTPAGILTRFETPTEKISRFALGIRLATGVDFKVDVITPLEPRSRGPNAQPLLRLMIGTPSITFKR